MNLQRCGHSLEFPSYGRPRITPELKRRGWMWATGGLAESCAFFAFNVVQ